MALTPEQEQYYDKLEDMFSTEGWKLLMEESRALIYQYQASSLEQKSWDAVNILKGKATQLAELINFEEVSAMQKAQLAEEEEDDANV